MDVETIIALGIFAAILLALAWLRGRPKKFEIKTTDIVVAVIPILILLVFTGRIQNIQFGEGKFGVAFATAAKAPVAEKQISILPLDKVQADEKAGTGDIPRLIEKKTQVLTFVVGPPGYVGHITNAYFEELTKHPYLQYIVIETPDRAFVGLANARDFAGRLRASTKVGEGSSTSTVLANDFVNWLRRGDTSAIENRLPGFVPLNRALVIGTTTTRDALERMEQLQRDTLPAVNDKKQFVGVVTRARLTAALVLEVTRQLDSK